MTLDDLLARAASAKEAGCRLTLVLPQRGTWPSRFPRGELLCVNQAGDRAYSFKPQKILEWVTRQIDEGGGA